MSTSDKWRQARRRDLSASRPAEAGSSQAKPGQERRVRLKDPAVTGEGRHSLKPGESSTEAGEERQVSRRKDGRDWPDDPEPRDGDGEGTRSRREKHRSGIHRRPKPAMVGYWRLTMETGFWEHGG